MTEDLLKTDDLHNLKEGSVFIDKETGKKYRVKKTILPDYSSCGPYGLGDPEDRTLRRIEADVIIPNRMNSVIEKVECKDSYIGLIRCLRTEGSVRGLFTCQNALDNFNRCKAERFHNSEFRERVTEEYLKERSEVRRTGMTEKQRKLEEFREWKRSQSLNEKTSPQVL